MAQPDFPAIGNHLQDIQNGFRGFQNQVALIANMPAVVGYNELRRKVQEQTKQLRHATNAMRRDRKAVRRDRKAARRERKVRRVRMKALRQRTKGLKQKGNQLRLWADGKHTQTMAILAEIRGQIEQIQNEYV